ncbi:ABC transporter permease [Ferruginibacter sp. HRS2-29]|uniref:ABC transporter permease n=1 Tax=Ferruginibacter sp. HRS2-29 TaxID=2487334 RepID=UPI0020CE4D8A|nr:ABC transporter permease [Ferruginibacter sp. HRS2-29]MCP9750276.1 ABC transporter permease [Ferruginibacter sp. HRS2-29]
MTYKNSLALSWKNVRSNRLRTAITVIIMALGIFALILIITAIKAASNSLTSSFSTMGANSFGIRYRDRNIRFGGGGGSSQKTKKSAQQNKTSNTGIPISYDEARLFKERFSFPSSKVGISLRGPASIVVNTNITKTNPDVNTFGGDDNYLEINGYKLAYGRNFTASEVETGRNVCMLGSAVAEKLFPVNPSKAIDAIVNVNHIPYRVIAVLEEKSSSAFFNTSRVVITTYNNIRRMQSSQNANYNIAVMVSDLKLMDVATGEAKGIFRPIRKLSVADDDNFFIDKSDSIAEAFLTNLGFLESGTLGIAFITLIGAAIGLMNIMLVAVNERTKEIGLTKALGGTKKDIRSQFLFESLLISLMGAIAGIIAGILIGNLVALLLHTGFVVPWGWVAIAIIVCSLVGLAAGLYPAYKASNLDPIVALRYE